MRAQVHFIRQPELSDWECVLSNYGGHAEMVWRPERGREPSAFWRLTQHLVLGFRWRRIKK